VAFVLDESHIEGGRIPAGDVDPDAIHHESEQEMAELVMAINRRMKLLNALLAMGITIAVVPWAAAEILRDPTRPPNLEGTALDGGAQAIPAGPVLQSILISPGRKVAVISGQQVRLGDTVGDARVVRLTDSDVTLQRGKETQVLKLFSGVEKRFANKPNPIQWPPQTQLQRQ
jgi:MSHA biogenesis protein MshK